MGRKSAHTGESPKDRSINIMDKFIARSNKQQAHKTLLPARRKDPNVPVDMWPLKDQIEYWESRTAADRFNEEYAHYSKWLIDVQQLTGTHPSTFTSYIKPIQETVKGLFESKTFPKVAARELRKLGVY
jgi:hypothetical protein